MTHWYLENILLYSVRQSYSHQDHLLTDSVNIRTHCQSVFKSIISARFVQRPVFYECNPGGRAGLPTTPKVCTVLENAATEWGKHSYQLVQLHHMLYPHCKPGFLNLRSFNIQTGLWEIRLTHLFYNKCLWKKVGHKNVSLLWIWIISYLKLTKCFWKPPVSLSYKSLWI